MNSTGKLELSCYVAGRKISSTHPLVVHSPYDGRQVGSVTRAQREDTEAAIAAALSGGETLTRFQRSAILDQARQLLEERREDFARLITSESGLCLRETRYEVGRALDVLRFAAMEALRDDGQIFSGDVSPQGKARKIFTVREPLALVVAITPFNHPLNQVAHKVAPAIAAGAPLILNSIDQSGGKYVPQFFLRGHHADLAPPLWLRLQEWFRRGDIWPNSS